MAHPEEARDPSMEEILASIRKIIAEDGPEAPQPTPHLTVVSDQSDRALEPESVAGGEDVEESLGDKLARKAGAERNKSGAISAPETDDVAEPMNAAAESEALDEAVEPETEPEPEPEVPLTDAAPAAPAADAAVERAAAEPAIRDASISDDPTPVAAAMAVGRPQQVDGNNRLLSPQADSAVHSAFDQLASTIMNDQARTIEDLVKDMMRPMLQNWLDDNLPVLVERLVREEIERVSRGRR